MKVVARHKSAHKSAVWHSNLFEGSFKNDLEPILVLHILSIKNNLGLVPI